MLGVSAAYAVAPHVALTPDTEACAICHRAHSAASTITVEPQDGGEARSALIGGRYPGTTGDTALCFSCHDGLGATADILTDFGADSVHRIAPDTSAFGPSPKQCNSCHDSHGTARTSGSAPGGMPYPALLESVDASGTWVRTGDAFCATCHVIRDGSDFPGIEVWSQTAHAGIATAAGGTAIVCSVCHVPHGSEVAPLIRQQITPPAVATTQTVTANDRTQCIACHTDPLATWAGATVYATGAHASSPETVAVTGEWASAETTRAVGECQSCHAAMGAVDADGDLVPKLQRVEQPASCRACHSADGPASTDFASLAHRPGPGMLSIAAAFGGSTETTAFGGLDLFSRRTTDTPTLYGPRRFADVSVSSPVISDFDDDGKNELVVAYAESNRIAVLGQDRNRGLEPDPGDYALLDSADLLVAGDVLDAYDGPELITARRGADFVQVYRWSGVTFAPVVVGGRVALGPSFEITGMTAGSVAAGGTQVVLTANTDTGSKLVVIEGGSGLTTTTPVNLRDGATAPVAHDHDADALDEIVVANSGVTSPIVSIIDADGTEVATAGSAVDTSATAVWMANVLPDIAGTELSVSLASDAGTARVEVFPASGLGFAASQVASLPAGSAPSALGAGDVDGDSVDELVVGLSGTFSRTGSGSWPGVAVIGSTSNGLALASPSLRPTGATEGAGSASVAVGDLGPIGPSRHPAGESGSHLSTETVLVESHVVCADCHDPHSAKTIAATAPDVMGLLRNVWGVSVRNLDPTDVELTEKQGVDYEYEVCLKCHSAWSETGKPVAGMSWPETIGAVRSIASELNTQAASFHPVEGPAAPNNSSGALVAGVTSGSQVYCTSCHGTSAAGPAGPHTSPASPLLKATWTTGDSDDVGELCYTCHRVQIYGPASSESTATAYSGFFDADLPDHGMHAEHTSRGFSCAACHVSHGSATLPALLRDDTGWVDPVGDDAGECETQCHTGGAAHGYTGP